MNNNNKIKKEDTFMNRTLTNQGQKRRKSKKEVVFLIITLLLLGITIVTAVLIRQQYDKTHFSKGTTIQGTDCSSLTVEEAKAKLEETIKQNLSFTVMTINESEGTKEYVPSQKQIEEISLNIEVSKLEEILKNQHEKKETNSSEVFFSVNEEALREYMENIPELKEENMIPAQNAYLQLGEDLRIEIVPETVGNEIDFEEAFNLATQQLKVGNAQISFESITKTQARITKDNEELQKRQKEINDILSTTIQFQLKNGEIVTLDDATMKNWIQSTEEVANVTIEIEQNLQAYVEELAEKVWKANAYVTLPATDIGNINIYVGEWARVGLDKEKELEHIFSLLGNAQKNEAELIYNKPLIETQLDNHIEVDITRQTVWIYKDGECILETPCVTGKPSAGNGTPTGVYYLSYKTTNAVLKGYNSDGSLAYASPVKYWMPFNGGIGFHDASWQASFGGSRYLTHGSHGCVNLPFESAKILYENIDSQMPIIVYAS